MNSEANWAQAAQHMRETLGEGFKQAMGAFSMGQAAGLPQVDLAAFKPPAQGQPPISFDPAKLLALQQRYVEEASSLWNQCLQPGNAPAAASDRPEARRDGGECGARWSAGASFFVASTEPTGWPIPACSATWTAK